MTRPRRLYKSGKEYYYLIKGKKVFVKVPDKVSQKQIQKVNIKNIITIPEARRIKRKRKKTGMTYEKKVDKNMVQGLSSYYSFVPERVVKPIQEQIASNLEKNIKKTDDTTVEKLTDIIGKLTAQSKLPVPAIENEPKVFEQGTAGFKFGRQEFTNLSDRERAMAAGNIVNSEPATPSPVDLGNLGSRGRILKPSAFRPTGQESKEDTRKGESKEPDRPTYSKPTRQQREEYLKKGESGLMPSLRNPKEEKGIPSSFSAASTKDSAGGIPKSDAERAREEARAFLKEEKPSGGDVDNGLYTDQVETIARKRLKHFVPVIANDQTENLMKYVKRGDKEFAFIINTDDSSESGRHWRCVYIDNRDDYKTVEYYDPLTETKMPENIRAITKKICMKMNPEMLFKFKSNAIRQQARSSSRCGIFCINFLEQRHNGIPFSEASGYDTFINELKSKGVDIDGSEKGEIELSKKIPMYSSYI